MNLRKSREEKDRENSGLGIRGSNQEQKGGKCCSRASLKREMIQEGGTKIGGECAFLQDSTKRNSEIDRKKTIIRRKRKIDSRLFEDWSALKKKKSGQNKRRSIGAMQGLETGGKG